jgi:hypothetical protein
MRRDFCLSDVWIWPILLKKVESRSFAEFRLNGSEIFDLIWLPLQIDYGHLGLTRPRIMRPPASLSRNEAYDAGKFAPCPQTDFFNRIGPSSTSCIAFTYVRYRQHCGRNWTLRSC